MKDYFIFPALMSGVVVATLFESPWFIVLALVLLIRLTCLKKPKVLIITVILGILIGIRCQAFQQNRQFSNFQTATFAPDKISVNGDILSGELNGSQNVRFIYRIKTESEQYMWQNLTQLTKAKVKIDQVQSLMGPRNPGEFNFKKYSHHRGVFYQVNLKQIKHLQTVEPQSLSEKINVLRIHIINQLSNLPKWLKIHSQSLLVGYVPSSEKDFLKTLSILGIIHLFSLSGLHVLVILTFIRKITSFFKIPIDWIDLLFLMILPCYGLLVGSKSGIWRAIILAMLSIVLKKLNITVSKLDLFSLTLLICTFIYPFAMIEMGGQLSFLLAFSILYLFKKTNLLLATLKMNLVSLPLICFYTYQFNWLTIVVNLIFVPLFMIVILPMTLISALTVHWTFWNFINQIFDHLYHFLDTLALDNHFIFITGKFPIAMVLLIVVVTLFYVESRNFWNRYLLSYLILFWGCVFLNKFPLTGSVNLIDVGQGDSILITTPLNRKVIMIDVAGKVHFPTKPWAKHDSGNQVDFNTLPVLKSKGIDHVDKLFLTHKDVDHIGNLETLLTKFDVREVNFGIGLENDPKIKRTIQNHSQIKFKNLRQGDTAVVGPINFQVLWPKVSGKGENSDSLTLLTRVKDKNWLFTGDLDIPSENKILKTYNFKVDYLKLGHHGSKTATGDKLLQITKPNIGLISAGVHNRYGHPNQETLTRLKKHQVQYFNTAEYGMISWYYNFFNNEERLTTFLKGDLSEGNGTKK
ncbi:DNA internalization-related competence protein ComEC/Rec2 [Companilactobacillus farciminis]|nr:DNA internalization-related competence protein ComEC/Rec2 [Companilactobacillus farciminis]